MPVVPPVSKTKIGLPASPFGIQRCTGPPRSHSSWNSPKRLRSSNPLISRARIPPGFLAKSSQNGVPVAGSKCQSTTSRTQRVERVRAAATLSADAATNS